MDTTQTNPNQSDPNQIYSNPVNSNQPENQIPTMNQPENQTPIVNQSIQVQPENGMSQDTKTIIVVILLVLVYPIGVILMFAWMKKWSWWVKLLAMMPIILVIVVFFVGAFIPTLSLKNSDPQTGLLKNNVGTQTEKARDSVMKNDATELNNAIVRYYAHQNSYPWGSETIYQSDDVGKELWLTELVDKNDLKQSFIERIGKYGAMTLSADTEGVKICFQENVPTKNTICVPEE